jgi:predicted DNA-binding mobile mystery protein A
MDASFQRLARRQLSQALARYVEASRTPRPRDGWIAALREALDMTVRQLAARLGVSPSSIVRLERRERDDTISLGALRRAANALDCDLVYAVVPRSATAAEPADALLDSLIEARAREVAAAELGRIAHTMALEDQTVSAADLQSQIAERAAAVAATPRRLWGPEVVLPAAHGSSTRRTRSE